MGIIMSKCEIDNTAGDQSFDEVYAGMQKDAYWIRFFVRPCCPAPNVESAMSMLDRLAGEVNARSDYSREEKEQLVELIDMRRSWYPNSGLVRTPQK